MSVDFYLDDFVFPPYVFRVVMENEEQVKYYGMRVGLQLHFLWWVLEVTW